jgi:predicted RNA-binding Zn ribbon-like protein
MVDPRAFLWIGNHPATDLCNTRPVVDGQRVELLPDFVALVTWAQLAGVTTTADVDRLSSGERHRTVTFIHRLRDALRVPLESGRRDAEAVRSVNEAVGDEPGVLAVSFARPDPVVISAPTAAAQLRLDLAAAALDIFRYDPGLVRRCANPSCVLVFLDNSKSRRRRWCDMSTCGNRAKAAAHYARSRTA